MPPVTIKSPELIDGLWVSQIVLAILMVAGWFFLPWPWVLLTIFPVIVMARNHRQIDNNQSCSIRLNHQGQWFVVNMGQLYPCQLSHYWHMTGILSLRLESALGTHHFIISKQRLDGACYAQLLMAVNQNEQQTE
ncbi:MAG: hypothetical protein OQK49_02005 [Proteobacteria bacterium]|nr:hypothetical protein [Pseudomonadota bacterium]